jgi:hypothetical protein
MHVAGSVGEDGSCRGDPITAWGPERFRLETRGADLDGGHDALRASERGRPQGPRSERPGAWWFRSAWRLKAPKGSVKAESVLGPFRLLGPLMLLRSELGLISSVAPTVLHRLTASIHVLKRLPVVGLSVHRPLLSLLGSNSNCISCRGAARGHDPTGIEREGASLPGGQERRVRTRHVPDRARDRSRPLGHTLGRSGRARIEAARIQRGSLSVIGGTSQTRW